MGSIISFYDRTCIFVLLETSITKGIRAALIFDLGVVFADFVFILIAYFSTNQILQKLKDDPGLFIFGGAIMLSYGVVAYIKEKRTIQKNWKKILMKITSKKTIT